ncbi:E3 ubiquitin ligase [Ophidiomyces ophidiicola]|uniref:E3 ubiquitin ligase n=1 Tax=Ophidiomyces ophidiicola TaxID=1387563 RepID=UPI0020C31AA1|nr:E3 ubiquitin ligase [Ophidiomyces ophidiicola]KAI1950900.1 E3 ubiquitin ligase [Ophidiomyces ophidiicola]KAI2047607.1 E3 ubiquitin ligase [Ophidiomyces ophidiicola]
MSSGSRKRKSPGSIDEGIKDQQFRTSQQPGPLGLLQIFQKDIDDIRALISCGVCVRPLYEPFTLGCGHTFCYGCLTQWFDSHERRKTCPDCRSPVLSEPAPAYMIRNIVQIFITRSELLDKDETTAEHLEHKRSETEKIELDKKNEDERCGGLFHGYFKNTTFTGLPIRDLTDGVERCPRCAWELDDGECVQCGYTIDDSSVDDYHGYDLFDEAFAHLDAMRHNREFIGISDDEDYDSGHPRSEHSPEPSRSNSIGEGSSDEWESDDMGSFIVEDEEVSEDSDTPTTSTVVGNRDRTADGPVQPPTEGETEPSEISDSVSEGVSEQSFPGLFRNPTIIELDDDDDDDEPIRPQTMASRRRLQRIDSSSPASRVNVSLSVRRGSSETDDSSSDGMHNLLQEEQSQSTSPRGSPYSYRIQTSESDEESSS